jgi:uncharacterized protein YkwD
MEDWVQLTEEDIERATRLTRAGENTPDVITVTMDDVPSERGPSEHGPSESEPQAEAENAVLAITQDDLTPAAPQPQAEPDIERLEQLMFQLVNVTRRHHLPGWLGTANLTWDPKLAAIARQHSSDMLRRQYVAHVTPEGVTAAQRLRQHNVSYVACGENIGIVYGRAAHSERAVQDIHNAFMRQPRGLTNHRGNLLNPIWTHVGIGIAYNPDGALVATQNFISAPAARLRGQ